ARKFLLWCDNRDERSLRRGNHESTIYFETTQRARRLGDVLRAVCSGRHGGGKDFAPGTAVAAGNLGAVHFARVAADLVARAQARATNSGIGPSGPAAAGLLRDCACLRRATDIVFQALLAAAAGIVWSGAADNQRQASDGIRRSLRSGRSDGDRRSD